MTWLPSLPLTCEAILGTTQIPLEEYESLRVGDVLLLDRAPSTLRIEGQHHLSVFLGLDGLYRAVVVYEE